MKKFVFFCMCFMMMSFQDAQAQDMGQKYDYYKKRLQQIKIELKSATGARRKSLLRQKFLVRARLARLSRLVCEERPNHSPIKGGKGGCKKKRDRRKGSIVPKYRFPTVKVVCPKNRKFGSKFDRKSNILTIYLCNGLDGKDAQIKRVLVRRIKWNQKPRAEYKDSKLILYLPRARRGRRGRPGDKIKSVEVVQLAHGEKPRAEYRRGKLTFYLPKAKDGMDGKPGKPGQKGKDGDRILPDWLKIYTGGFYLLSKGPAWRHNFGGMVGMGFVLVPKYLDLVIEGGIGYETQQHMLSVYAKGGLQINFHRMVGMNLSAFGNWNLNYRNLSNYELLGGAVGVYGLFFNHLRLSADLLLTQLRWPEAGGVHRTFGVSGIFTIGYQF